MLSPTDNGAVTTATLCNDVQMDRIRQYTRGSFTFDVIDSGPLDGDPVILLHGFPERAASWLEVAARLNEAGLRTYAVDQRGYSPGARPRSRFAYRSTELVADVKALIDLIGRPVHVVGHDWGAAVAWGLAGKHPESVTSLTAVSVPHPAAFMRSMVTSTQGLKSYYMLLFQLPWLPSFLLSRPKIAARFLRGAGMNRTDVDTYLDQIVADGALKGGLGWYRSLPLTSPSEIRRVSVPTTYVWSDRDVALGRKGAETCERWVDGPYRFEVIEGATHWLPTQHPDALATSILQRVDA